MERKNVCKTSQFFSYHHKINESNAIVPKHYWIVCLYSKYIIIPDKFFNLFKYMFNTKTIELNNFTSVRKQSNPVCVYVCIFIKVFYVCPILYLFRRMISWKNSIKSWFILIILCISKFVKGWGGIKNSILFYFHNQLFQFLFLSYFQNQLLQLPPAKIFSNRLAPKVPNNMLKNPPFCSFVLFLIISVTPFNKILESSRAWTISLCHLFISLKLLKLLSQNRVFSFEFMHHLLNQLLLFLMEQKYFC